MATLLEIAQRQTTLTQRGAEWWGLCPFHTEHSPSFSVNPEKGVYSCFGCGAAGDAITMLRQLEGKSFREAAAEVGKALPPRDPPLDAQVSRLRRAFEDWRERRFRQAYQALKEARIRLVSAQFAQRCFQLAPATFTPEETASFANELLEAETDFQAMQTAFLLMSPEGDEEVAIRIWEETR